MVILLAAGNTASAQSLQMEVTYMPVHRLSPADVDFQHGGGTNLLFTIQILNSGESTVSVALQGVLNVHLASGEFSGQGASFKSNFFDAPHGTKIIRNFDLYRTGSIGMDHSDVDGKFQGYINDGLASGLLPEGEYTFVLTLVDANGNSLDGTKEVVFNLKNTSRAELRSPRDGESTNEFPLFEFSFDGDRATIRVAEIGEGQSREDAMSRRPLMLEADVVGNSYSYNSGRPLENGKTYAWQLSVDQALAGGGTNSVVSPIWEFTVSGANGGGSESAIIRQLEDIFGNRYPDIFKAIHDGGFTPSDRFMLNGSTISLSDLLNLLNEIRQNADAAELTFE
jgi:hypothetical protein